MPASRWNASRRQRGLWIAAGALLTLVVIVLIAVQLRNRLGVTGNAPAIQQTRVEDSKQSTGIGVSNPAPPSRTPDKKIEKPIVPVAENPKPAPAIQAEPQKKAASNQPADSSENAATISQPSAAQNQLAEQMKSLRARFEDLRNRADTIKASLANLRRQRGDVKLGMRPEIALVARRMEFHLNSAKEGLESGNPRSVKINLDSAEREIIRLTKLANLRKPVN